MGLLIDLGRAARPVSSARRDLGGVATLAQLWIGDGDFPLEVGLIEARAELSASKMRDAWNARRDGRPVPVVLLQPVGQGYRVCGPEGAPPPVRDLPEAVVATILRRALALTPDVVVEALRAELARGLGSGGVPGVRNNGLVSTHYLLDRLPKDAARWSALGDIGRPALGREGRDIFTSLGYEVAAPAEGELLLRHEGVPLALVHLYRGAHLLDRFIDDAGTPASAFVLARARVHGAPYGMLVAGPVARLLSRRSSAQLGESAPSAAFLEIATDLLPATHAGVIGACYAPGALRDGGQFVAVREASERYAVELRGRFRERVYRDVVPGLVSGIARAARAQRVAVEPGLLYRATMLALFRTLFVLYAEDRDLLPVASPSYRPHSLTARIDGIRQTMGGRGFDAHAADLWEDLKRIFGAVAVGRQDWGVPPYDGGLFVDDAGESPEGALLARLRIADRDFGPALHGLAVDTDPEGAMGKVDFGDLGVRHIGNLYEGLLSYEVAVAEEDLAVDEGDPDQVYVPARKGQTVVVPSGEPYMRSPKGGRKASGSYYTPTFVVDRLVGQSVVPALDRHLARVAAAAPKAAGDLLWDFKVCDPAMGSGHFLVSVVDAISERIAAHLAEHPVAAVREELERARLAVQKATEAAGATEVAEVKDIDVLRRLVLKRCVYGVDLNPMAVELARLSLWLHAFVPGLPLFYLGHTLRHGNSLFGMVGTNVAPAADQRIGLFTSVHEQRMSAALAAAREIALTSDLELHEVERSRERQADLDRQMAGERPLLDLYAADPLVDGTARRRIDAGELLPRDDGSFSRDAQRLIDQAAAVCAELDAFHWTLAFPEVFLRERAGFDVVVANPPWEEVTVEELGFYTRYMPGLKSERSRERQRARVAEFAKRHPDVRERYEQTVAETEAFRTYLKASFELTRSGDPDLYKAFAERFLSVVRAGGAIGVVLPRTAFGGHGTQPFRERLFTNASAVRLDFLLNRSGWVFEDAEPRYTVALLAADFAPGVSAKVSVAGPADRPEAFATLDSRRIEWAGEELKAADYAVPLVPEPSWAALFRHCYVAAPRFDANVGDWRAVPYAELHATNDYGPGHLLSRESGAGWPVYSGDSFDLWKPEHETPPFKLDPRRGLPALQQKRLGSSLFRREFAAEALADPSTQPQHKARILFRDVSRATDSRTVRACLVPPKVFAVNAAPSLIFPRGDEQAQAFVLGLLCSLPFDWIARRRVENHLNFFILDSLPFPRPEPADAWRRRIAELAARLACVDDRFADFARACGVRAGPLTETERADHIAEIDALVAHLYGLDAAQLEIVFADFTANAVPPKRRDAVRRHFASVAT